MNKSHHDLFLVLSLLKSLVMSYLITSKLSQIPKIRNFLVNIQSINFNIKTFKYQTLVSRQQLNLFPSLSLIGSQHLPQLKPLAWQSRREEGEGFHPLLVPFIVIPIYGSLTGFTWCALMTSPKGLPCLTSNSFTFQC